MPAGVSEDAQNPLWVTEYDSCPKGVRLWDCAQGKRLKEFFGAAAYSPGIYAAWDKPEEVFINNVRHIVDYDKGAYKVDATIWRARYEDGMVWSLDAANTFSASAFSETTYEGKRIASDGYTLFDDKGDHFVPRFVMCNGAAAAAPWFMPNPDHKVGYVWSDANGDGKTQSNEVHEVNVNLARGNRCSFGTPVM